MIRMEEGAIGGYSSVLSIVGGWLYIQTCRGNAQQKDDNACFLKMTGAYDWREPR